MKTKLLMTVATAALIGSAGLASAQAPTNAPNAPAASQPAPSAGAPAERAAPMNREAPAGEMKGQRAQDKDGMKSKGAETTRDPKGGKAASETNMDKSKDGMKTDRKDAAEKDGMKADQKNAGEGKAGATTGQAGAGAKLSTEQRTTIRTSITKQNIKPVTNINFSISVGTRVPRTVGFHPLPAEVITIYPAWRGYEFFLVNGEIIVVNPRTLEIVAVLEA
ncbi:MAG: DUF1236 domain-containing protein [Afipia sp.]|nr:DUF1236 domain-containing protein [Afipia sp.]